MQVKSVASEAHHRPTVCAWSFALRQPNDAGNCSSPCLLLRLWPLTGYRRDGTRCSPPSAAPPTATASSDPSTLMMSTTDSTGAPPVPPPPGAAPPSDRREDEDDDAVPVLPLRAVGDANTPASGSNIGDR